METNNPTPEDYAINPKEALDINAKATQGTWLHITSPPARENIYFVEKDMPLHLAGICGNATGLLEDSANARAIAYNHNSTPGLARRLIELEEVVVNLGSAMANETDLESPGQTTQRAVLAMMKLASLIKKGREHAKAN